LIVLAKIADHLGLETEFSVATVAGAFLSLHVSGRRADRCFRLEHPMPLDTIRAALDAYYNQDRAQKSQLG
jgi:hypothetical protein